MFAHSHGVNTPSRADIKLQILHMKLERGSNNHLRRAGISWLQHINHWVRGCNILFVWSMNLKNRICMTHNLLKRISEGHHSREAKIKAQAQTIGVLGVKL